MEGGHNFSSSLEGKDRTSNQLIGMIGTWMRDISPVPRDIPHQTSQQLCTLYMTKFSTISLYMTKLFVTLSFAIAQGHSAPHLPTTLYSVYDEIFNHFSLYDEAFCHIALFNSTVTFLTTPPNNSTLLENLTDETLMFSPMWWNFQPFLSMWRT